MGKTLSQRCATAEQRLPDGPNREALTILHADMLCKISEDRARLDRALVVCRCALRVIESSAYQGISDEDCDLETSVRDWKESRKFELPPTSAVPLTLEQIDALAVRFAFSLSEKRGVLALVRAVEEMHDIGAERPILF